MIQNQALNNSFEFRATKNLALACLRFSFEILLPLGVIENLHWGVHRQEECYKRSYMRNRCKLSRFCFMWFRFCFLWRGWVFCFSFVRLWVSCSVLSFLNTLRFSAVLSCFRHALRLEKKTVRKSYRNLVKTCAAPSICLLVAPCALLYTCRQLAHLFVCLFLCYLYVSATQSGESLIICLFVWWSDSHIVCLSISLAVWFSHWLVVRLSVFLPVCLSVCLSVSSLFLSASKS